ncbi:MAG: phage tail protein [Burkholderiales bacterium]|nr:phage tail protein [Burkholderiales bacterium]
MATFTWTPSFPIADETEPRVAEARFGDGYAQRVPDGINSMAPSWDLTFKERTLTEIGDIVTFLRARNGAESFDWTPPGGAAGKFICRRWQRSRGNALYADLRATFEQVFEP